MVFSDEDKTLVNKFVFKVYCVPKYQYRSRFDKVIRKNNLVQFLPHMVILLLGHNLLFSLSVTK